MLKKIYMNMIGRLAETDFAKTAIEERADLNEFKQKPTPRILLGLFAILMSYVICWPLISLLGIISVYLKKPLIVAVGGPLAYGTSHLVFILGMYLCGAYYSKVFLKWAARMAVEKATPEKTEGERIN